MTTEGRLTLGPNGQIILPAAVLAHYGLTPEASLRVVETSSGILLVPEQIGRIPESLAAELREWQDLYDEGARMFIYDDQGKDGQPA